MQQVILACDQQRILPAEHESCSNPVSGQSIAICNSSRIFSRRAFSSGVRFFLAICNTSDVVLLFYTTSEVYTKFGMVSAAEQGLDLLPLGTAAAIVTNGTVLRKAAGTLDKFQLIVPPPCDDVVLVDTVHRPDQFHSFKVIAVQLGQHCLELRTVKHPHHRCTGYKICILYHSI